MTVLETDIAKLETGPNEAADSRFFYDPTHRQFALEHSVLASEALLTDSEARRQELTAVITQNWTEQFPDKPLELGEPDDENEAWTGFLFTMTLARHRILHAVSSEEAKVFDLIELMPETQQISDAAKAEMQEITKEDWKSYGEIINNCKEGYVLSDEQRELVTRIDDIAERASRYHDLGSIVRRIGEFTALRAAGVQMATHPLRPQPAPAGYINRHESPAFQFEDGKVWFTRYDELLPGEGRVATMADYIRLIRATYQKGNGHFPPKAPYRPAITPELPELGDEAKAALIEQLVPALPQPEIMETLSDNHQAYDLSIQTWNTNADVLPNGPVNLLTRSYRDVMDDGRMADLVKRSDFLHFDPSKRKKGIFVWQFGQVDNGQRAIYTLRVERDSVQAWLEQSELGSPRITIEAADAELLLKTIQEALDDPEVGAKAKTLRRAVSEGMQEICQKIEGYVRLPDKKVLDKLGEKAIFLKHMQFSPTKMHNTNADGYPQSLFPEERAWQPKLFG